MILPGEKKELLMGGWEEKSAYSRSFFFSFVSGWNDVLCVPPVCFPKQLCNVLADFKQIQGKEKTFRHLKFL